MLDKNGVVRRGKCKEKPKIFFGLQKRNFNGKWEHKSKFKKKKVILTQYFCTQNISCTFRFFSFLIS